MKERKIRVGPWDCEEKLLDRVSLYRARMGGKPWTWVLHKALRELMDREQVFLGAHAPNVESVSNPGSVESAAVVPVAGVPAPALVAPAPALVAPAPAPPELTEAEKRLAYAIKRRGDKQACLDAAYIEFASDPKSLRANNLIARMPKAIAEYDADIAEFKAQVEAERATKENSGEVLPGEEV